MPNRHVLLLFIQTVEIITWIDHPTILETTLFFTNGKTSKRSIIIFITTLEEIGQYQFARLDIRKHNLAEKINAFWYAEKEYDKVMNEKMEARKTIAMNYMQTPRGIRK